MSCVRVVTSDYAIPLGNAPVPSHFLPIFLALCSLAYIFFPEIYAGRLGAGLPLVAVSILESGFTSLSNLQCPSGQHIHSFPGPTQPFIVCSTMYYAGNGASKHKHLLVVRSHCIQVVDHTYQIGKQC